jgi:hypothetical protein
MVETRKKSATYGEVWQKLSSIDVSNHIQKKGNLSYLSWAWAWGVLKENYPESGFDFREFESDGVTIDYMKYPDGTASVHCTVHIGENVESSMWLPVMDFRNNAIQNPDSRDVSDAKMRCLVKAIALLGLGHYIYAGEDVPTSSASESSDFKPKTPAKKKASKKNGKDVKQDPVYVLHETFMEKIDQLDELKAHWTENSSEIAKLKDSKPEVYKAIFEKFQSKGKELKQEGDA